MGLIIQCSLYFAHQLLQHCCQALVQVRVQVQSAEQGLTLKSHRPSTHPTPLFSMKECSGKKVLIVKVSQNDPLDSSSQKKMTRWTVRSRTWGSFVVVKIGLDPADCKSSFYNLANQFLRKLESTVSLQI